MRGAGHADGFGILQVPGNKADAVPCEPLQNYHAPADRLTLWPGHFIATPIYKKGKIPAIT